VSETVLKELRDRQGGRYQMLDLSAPKEPPAIVIRSARGTRAGHARTALRDSDLEITSLHVEKALVTKPSGPLGSLGALLGSRPQAELRGNGFGSAMLEAVVRAGRRLGAKRVVVHISSEQREANQRLIKWFGKRGFHPIGTMAPGALTVACSLEESPEPQGPVLGRGRRTT
jgi:hypothetical protein